MKGKLKENEVIILLDFAENYQYIIQDENSKLSLEQRSV